MIQNWHALLVKKRTASKYTRNIYYDAMGQVVSVVENSVPTTMTYDSTYNLTTKLVGVDMTDYVYNDADQLTERMVNGIPVEEYEYDEAGRMTSRHPPSVVMCNLAYDHTRDRYNSSVSPQQVYTTNQTTYQYNDLGKLKQVTKPNSDVITFTYYGNGKRATKTVTTGTSSITWRYHYDQGMPVNIENLTENE